MSELRPDGGDNGARGTSILFILILLLLIGGLAFWGLRKTPTGTPDPATTSFPDTVPNKAP